MVTGRVETEEMRGEQRDVLTPIAQRGEPDFHGVEPEQQILTEASGLHLRVDVGVRGRHDAHVGTARARRAHALVFACLEHAQQLGLLRERQIGNLIQKQRATFGELEASDAIALGIGEGTPHVAEQLALEEPVRNAAEVHRDHGVIGPGRRRV